MHVVFASRNDRLRDLRSLVPFTIKPCLVTGPHVSSITYICELETITIIIIFALKKQMDAEISAIVTAVLKASGLFLHLNW